MIDERKAVKYHDRLVAALRLAVETIDEFNGNGITQLGPQGWVEQEDRRALLREIEAEP